MDAKVVSWIDDIWATGKAWINNLFGFFGLYTSKYAGWIIGALILFILSKMLKINIKTGGGGGGR